MSLKISGVTNSDMEKVKKELEPYLKSLQFVESDKIDEDEDEIDLKIFNKMIEKIVKENKDSLKEVMVIALPKNKSIGIVSTKKL